MLARVFSAATVGLTVRQIEVEVDVEKRGFPTFKIVGLPDKAVEEAKERIRAAMGNSQVSFPKHKIVINLAPADIPKAGPSFDLPMALGILIAHGQIAPLKEKSLFLGELSLNGTVRRVNGILPIVMAAKEKGFKKIFIPEENAQEGALVSNIEVYPIKSLRQLIFSLFGEKTLSPVSPLSFDNLPQQNEAEFDFADIVGQENAKRALEIAAAGGHNVFMKGPPGAGKTMLARALPGILPAMTEKEALEITKIYSIAGQLKANQSLISHRPFRSPHHTISRIGLIGGGTHPAPGEVSLAHRGALFVDEAPEFPRHVLEALRQPLEDGQVTIARAAGSYTFPAKFTLIAAANPCPCGWFGDPYHQCRCLPGQIARYQKKISGPLMDRIDIHLNIPSVKIEKLTGEKKTRHESSLKVRRRVEKARQKQLKRFLGTPLTCNAEMNTKEVKNLCQISPEGQNLLNRAAHRLALSARSYYRLIKVARTIADLDNQEKIHTPHIAEALQYRRLDH